MILLEQKIVLKILHRKRLKTYYALEVLNEQSKVCFLVIRDGKYVCNLLRREDDPARFQLSVFDRQLDKKIDHQLFLKVELSLHAAFKDTNPS